MSLLGNTANRKPLERRGLVRVVVDQSDGRVRRLELSRRGRILPDRLRADLLALSR